MTKRTRDNHPTGKINKAAPPRELTEIEAKSLKQAKKKITVREGSKSKKISRAEAMIMKQEEMAMKGSAHAMHQSIARIQRAQELEQEQIDLELSRAFLWRKNQIAKREQAKKNGQDPEAILPHPDDFVFSTKGYSIKGPIVEEDVARYEKIRLECETWLYQDVYEQRLDWSKEDPYGEYDELPFELRGGSALLMYSITELQLSERLKLTEVVRNKILLNARKITTRQLKKLLYFLWSRQGIPGRRGWRSPPLVFMRRAFDEFSRAAPLLHEHMNNNDDEAHQAECQRCAETLVELWEPVTKAQI